MTRIVLDTNVLVSGLLFGGVPGRIVSLWQDGKVRPLCSKAIVEEYLRVLAYPKFHLTESEISLLLSHEILPYFEVIEVKPGEHFVASDPEDDKFVWWALQGGAEMIVSGDEHLVTLNSTPIPVLTAAEFLKRKFPHKENSTP
jgi:putative PIN family toxin of toxin-antitoxin system